MVSSSNGQAGASSADQGAGRVQMQVGRLQLTGEGRMGQDESVTPSPTHSTSPNSVSETKRTFSWSRRTSTRNSSAVARARQAGSSQERQQVTLQAGSVVSKRVFSFARKSKPAAPVRQAGLEESTRSEDAERSDSLFSRTFRKGATPVSTRPGSPTLGDDYMHGQLLVRRVGKSREHKSRYCVLSKSSCGFEWYSGQVDESVVRERRADGACMLAVASLDPRTPCVFFVQVIRLHTTPPPRHLFSSSLPVAAWTTHNSTAAHPPCWRDPRAASRCAVLGLSLLRVAHLFITRPLA